MASRRSGRRTKRSTRPIMQSSVCGLMADGRSLSRIAVAGSSRPRLLRLRPRPRGLVRREAERGPVRPAHDLAHEGERLVLLALDEVVVGDAVAEGGMAEAVDGAAQDLLGRLLALVEEHELAVARARAGRRVLRE